jgi:hypothetical protein
MFMSFNFNWNAVSGGAPYVTLSTISIAFNSVSIAKLGNPEKVVVGFDEDQCAIGVKAYSGEENIKAYDFANKVKNGWVRIGCRDFIKYLSTITGMEFYPAKRYVARFDAKEDVLFVLVREAADNENEQQDE